MKKRFWKEREIENRKKKKNNFCVFSFRNKATDEICERRDVNEVWINEWTNKSRKIENKNKDESKMILNLTWEKDNCQNQCEAFHLAMNDYRLEGERERERGVFFFFALLLSVMCVFVLHQKTENRFLKMKSSHVMCDHQ